MGIARGTNIVRDGLVFGYDSGYGVSDPGLSTRFYKGKPTTNIASGAAFIHDTSSGNAGSVVDAPEKGDGWKKVTITARGSNFRTIQFGSYPSMTSNVTYASSFEVDWGNMRGKGYTITQDGSGGGTRNYFKNGSYATGSTGSVSIDSTLLDGHFGMNIVKNASHVHVPFIYGTTNTASVNDFFYYKEYQQEVGTIPTPYVAGTRSATTSLIDLKRTTDIDVSNVSFDSTGQPSWDGTNDKIVIPAGSFSNIGTDDFTIDLVFKNTKTSNYSHFFSVKDQYHFALKMSNTGDRNIYVYRTSALSTYTGISAYAPSSTGYYHLVCKREGDNLELYLNGVSKGTKSGWGSIDIQNDTEATSIGTHGTTSEFLGGELPVMKLYNRALTAAEVLQNYKAYKNRFNI